MARHQLIGAQVSLYTGKVRAYLDYKAIPYDEVTATREVYRDVIVARTGVRFIPVLISDDDHAIQDSSAIIDFLEARYPEPSIYPAGPVQRLLALLIETYADEWLVIPAMHYRWNIPDNRAFASAEFGRLSVPSATPEEQLAIGERLAGPFAGALPALGVHPNNTAEIEASYLSFLTDFARHLDDHPYLFGTRPSLGDFALYGPLYAHLYRDPASGRLMQAHAPNVARWVERMRDPQPQSGAFLPDDGVPDTLKPLLSRMFREFGPVLIDTQRALASFEPEPADAPLPRVLGTHAFQLGQATSQRAIYPFNLWRAQRVRDQYQALAPQQRARADALLQATGGATWLASPAPPRLTRRNNRLYLDLAR